MLRREQKIRNIILFTLFSFLFIGVGYAVISSNLQMNGSMTLNKITWDVHFENFEELYNNTVTGTNSLSNEDTTLTYNVTLNKPGDIYEFTVDIVNNGNIDAMLSSLGNSGLTSAQQEVLDYSVTYLDGSIPTEKDSLKAKEVETLVVSIKTKADITNSKLSATDTNLSLTLSPTYAQDDGTSTSRADSLYTTITKDAVLDNISSTYVSSSTGINFYNSSSDSNGKGKYIFASTKNNKYPIYYYRGDIDNNNVIFNNYCWSIVRTTENGGIKLIYNGIPSDGKCISETDDRAIGKSKFNIDSLLMEPTGVGYMYGNNYQRYDYDSTDMTSNYKYSQTVTYDQSTKKYTLNSPITATGTWETDYLNISNRHYTCKSSSTTCEKIYYVYLAVAEEAHYIELKPGDTIEEAWNEITSNMYDSVIKKYIDSWYNTNMNTVTYKLKDSIWCNDRTMYTGGFLETGSNNDWSWFSTRQKIRNKIDFICGSIRDSFTVLEKNGNGKMKYPVGLLTGEEISLGGIGFASNEFNNYLYTGNAAWTMSPNSYSYIWGSTVLYAVVDNNSGKNDAYQPIKTEYDVRPSIVLKQGIKIISGEGNSESPYIVN